MLKKLFIFTLISLILLAAGTVLAVNLIQHRAPVFLRDAIERSLNKKVVIRTIEYHFPWTFELQGFEVHEKGEQFHDEISFYVDHIMLDLSPMIFSQKALVISHLEVEDAEIVIRKFQGKLFHALSDVMKQPEGESVPSAGAAVQAKKLAKGNLPLEIHFFELKNCHFKFADYDIQPNGFVTTLDKINARIHDVSVPSLVRKTSYEIDAELLQERDERRARINISGWTAFDTMDTDATFSMTGVHLPYFRPYYGQVTPAALEDGYGDLRASIKMDHRVLDLSAGLELSGLLFESYENGDQLFGLKAEEVLSFLKDSAGRLHFQIVVKWDTADKSVKLKDVFRRGIERSLRQTVLGNVGNILMNALQKAGEGIDGPGKKGSIEEKIKKIKDFFKY